MTVSAIQMQVLVRAGDDEEGRVVVVDPNDGPMEVIGRPGEGPIVIGESGLIELVGKGYLRPDGPRSFLLTRGGWKLVGKQPPVL